MLGRQTGVVVGVRRQVDVRLSNGMVRRRVPTNALEPVLRFQADQYVLHSGWLGRIDFVEEAVTVRCMHLLSWVVGARYQVRPVRAALRLAGPHRLQGGGRDGCAKEQDSWISERHAHQPA